MSPGLKHWAVVNVDRICKYGRCEEPGFENRKKEKVKDISETERITYAFGSWKCLRDSGEKDSEMEADIKSKNITRYTIGMFIGLGGGLALGVVFNHIGLGIAIGLPLGVGLGFLFIERNNDE